MNAQNLKFRLFWFIQLFFYIVLLNFSSGAGVAVFKEQKFHSDATATPVVYDTLKISGPNVVTGYQGKFKTYDISYYVASIEVMASFPQNITNLAELEPIKKSLNDIQLFAKKYPKTAPILNNQIISLSEAINRFNAGKIFYNRKWINKEEYISIQEKIKLEQKESEKKEIARKMQADADKKSKEEFAVAQKAKGFALYKDKWLPEKEVAIMVKRDLAVEKCLVLLNDKSIENALYSIFQVIDDGHLIRLHDGKIKNTGINLDIVFLHGAAKGAAAEGDYYKGLLFWCGTYSYPTKGGDTKTVNAYSLDKDTAIASIAITLGLSDVISGKSPTVAQYPENSENNKSKSNLLDSVKSSGSGFFVGNLGHFVTNAHVVRDSSDIHVFHENIKYKAEVIRINRTSDLALLKIEKPVEGFVLASIDADIGLDVFTVGFPQPELQGVSVKITKGVISSDKGLQDDSTRYQIDAAVQPGNSGGPLCDNSGNLVGVVVAGLNQIAVAEITGSIPQNVNYAIKSSEVISLLNSKSIKAETISKVSDAKSDNNVMKSATTKTALVLVY